MSHRIIYYKHNKGWFTADEKDLESVKKDSEYVFPIVFDVNDSERTNDLAVALEKDKVSLGTLMLLGNIVMETLAKAK